MRGGPVLWKHLGALVGLVVVIWPILDLDGVFIADEGSYGVQVQALEAGGWDMGYAFREADPEGRFVPYHAAVVTDREVLPYVHHPAWPDTMHAATAVAGTEVGLRLVGVVSLVGLSVTAWFIGGDLGGERAGPWAFWLAASSPAVANAWMLWAHTPSAALGALLVLAGLRAPRSLLWVGVGGLAAVVGVLVRSEGLLWAAAVSVALLVLGAAPRQRLLGAAAGLAAAVTWRAERLWVSSIAKGEPTDAPRARDAIEAVSPLRSRGAGAAIGDRLEGVRIAFLDGSVAWEPGHVLGMLAVSCAVAAVVVIRRRGAHDRLAVLALAGCGAAYTVRLLLESQDPIPGLLPAAPVLLLALSWPRPERATWWFPASVLIFFAAIAVTIYPDGGAFQWGGRFLSPALGPLAAAAAVAIATHTGARSPSRHRRRQPLGIAVAVLILLQAGGAIVVTDRLRRLSERGVDGVVALGPDVVVTAGAQVARLDWRGWPERCWIALPQEPSVADAEELLDVLARSGIARTSYAGVDADVLRAAGGEVTPDAEGRPIGALSIAGPAKRLGISPPYRCGP